jgi:hypothetical protein
MNVVDIKKESIEALLNNPNDTYHKARVSSAQVMINNGFDDWTYVTQYSSGACDYRSPDGKDFKLVPFTVIKLLG